MATNLDTFESLVALERRTRKLTYAWFAERGISAKTVISIERGGNYRVSSLFKLVELMDCKVEINDKVINEYTQLGPFLKSLRIRFDINRVEMSRISGISMDSLNKLERGGDFTRSTLWKYGYKVGLKWDMLYPLPELGEIVDSRMNHQ